MSPSDPVTSGLSGTYINTQYPVTCGNYITKWHYCYYTQEATPGSTLSMTVAVWSLNTATNTYTVSPSSIKTITLQPVQTLAKVFCIEESLNETEFVQVSQDDVIGVVLPSSNAIPIISFSLESHKHVLKYSENETPVNVLQYNARKEDNVSMHLRATLSKLTIISYVILTDQNCKFFVSFSNR